MLLRSIEWLAHSVPGRKTCPSFHSEASQITHTALRTGIIDLLGLLKWPLEAEEDLKWAKKLSSTKNAECSLRAMLEHVTGRRNLSYGTCREAHPSFPYQLDHNVRKLRTQTL